MNIEINNESIIHYIPTQSLVESFSISGIENIHSFIQDLKHYIKSCKKEEVIKQIELIEKKIAQLGSNNTLFSVILDKFPDFAIEYIEFFKSSFELRLGCGNTVLIKACKEKKVEIVKALIKNGANVNALNAQEYTALAVCIKSIRYFPSSQDNEIFETLLKGGSDVNVGVDMVDSTPILFCASSDLWDWAWKLFPLSDLNRVNNLGLQLIHQAVRYRYKEMVSALIQKKVELNGLARPGIVSTRRISPCHIAVLVNDPEILAMLIRAGADPYLRASNPYFRKGDDEEPLSSFLMSADLGRKECLDVIVKSIAPSSSDFDPGYERTLLTIPHERIGKMAGYASLSTVAEAGVCKSTLQQMVIEKTLCYVEPLREKEILSLFNNYFTGTYPGKAACLYLPIWNVVNCFAQNKNQFSIIFSPQETDKCGKYNSDTKTEIIIYSKHRYGADLGGTVIHEMAHRCADLIYQTSDLAPSDPNNPFYQAIQIDMATLSAIKNNYTFLFHELFGNITLYDEKSRPAEYLARIPQTIFLLIHRYQLSLEEVHLCMEESLPNLFKFYCEDFLPACKKLSGTGK